jgi:Ca2+-binding RTX toxin-like protein
LIGGEGDDVLDGGSEADSLFGGTGLDFLTGGDGDDVLVGGAGADSLMGGAGGDLYIIGAGDGIDAISDSEGVNRIQFTGAFGPAGFKLSQIGTGGALRVTYGTQPTEVLTISDGLTSAIQEFEFASGGTYSLKQVLNLAETDPITLSGAGTSATLTGGSGNDHLTAGNFGVLDGGRGDDSLAVAPQATTLTFSMGDGDDIVIGGTQSITFVFDDTVDSDSLLFVRPDPEEARVTSPRDLILNYGESDSIFIPDSPFVINYSYAFSQGQPLNHVRLLERSGLELRWTGSGGNESISATRFEDELSAEAGADTLHGMAGSDTLGGGAGMDTLHGDAGNDTLIGGTESDTLRGGDGNDRYFFSSGDGVDIVVDNLGTDVIEFDAGIALNDATAELVNGTDGNIYLAVGYTGGTVLVRQNFQGGVSPGAIAFHFTDDNITLGSAELSSSKLTAPLNFRGANEAMRISGGAFDDTLIGSTQDDRLEGGDGDDQLAGDAGSDFIAGGTGDDLMIGNAGDDTLDGGAGADTYRLQRGIGQDWIVESGEGLNTIELASGLEVSDLSWQRSGNDLSLHLAGTRDGLHIQDYFVPGGDTSAQRWQVRLSNESNLLLEDMIGSMPEVLRPIGVQALIDDFTVRTQAARRSELIAIGYRLQPDGTFLAEEFLETLDLARRTLTTRRLLDTFQAGEGEIQRGPVSALVSTSITSTQDRVSYQELNTNGSTFVPFRFGGNHPAAGNAGAARYFNLDGSGYSGVSYSGVEVGVYGPASSINPFAVTQSGVSERNLIGFYTFPSGAPSYMQRDNQPHVTEEITYVIESYFEKIQAGASDDFIRTQPYSVVDAGAGNDTVSDDTSGSSPGALGNLLYGGPGNDVLIGGGLDDLLIGGTGDDRLEGGGGNDTYALFDGDGVDVLYDNGPTQPGIARENVLDLPVSVTPEALVVTPKQLLWMGGHGGFSLHSALELSWGNGDLVTVVLPHSDLNAGTGIDVLRFADGTRISVIDFAAGLADPHDTDNELVLDSSLYGGGGDDVLRGSGLVIGGEGSDLLIGSGLDDLLCGGDLVSTGPGGDFPSVSAIWDVGDVYRGGAGNDVFSVTAGSDVFEFQKGDGTETITDKYHNSQYLGLLRGEDWPVLQAETREPDHHTAMLAGQDTLRFGAGIMPSDIAVRRVFSITQNATSEDLVFAHDNGTDAVRFENWYPYARGENNGLLVVNQISRVEFVEDGTVWDKATIDALAADAKQQIEGTEFDDFLFGSPAADQISGNAGNDYLYGFWGDDVLDGGAGDDIYFFHKGDGVDLIRESGIETFDVVSFGDGITPEMLTLGSGSLLIRIGDTGDAIHIENFDAGVGSAPIETFRFSNGNTLTLADLLSRGFQIDGSFDDDALTGTASADRMDGFGGNDALDSGAGDDRIDGGSGDDVLEGGAGNDTYVFSSFSGLDRIEDSGGPHPPLFNGSAISCASSSAATAAKCRCSGGRMKAMASKPLSFSTGRYGMRRPWSPWRFLRRIAHRSSRGRYWTRSCRKTRCSIFSWLPTPSSIRAMPWSTAPRSPAVAPSRRG